MRAAVMRTAAVMRAVLRRCTKGSGDRFEIAEGAQTRAAHRDESHEDQGDCDEEKKKTRGRAGDGKGEVRHEKVPGGSHQRKGIEQA